MSKNHLRLTPSSGAEKPNFQVLADQLKQEIQMKIDFPRPVLSESIAQKNGIFPLRDSSVNVTKSTGKCEFGHMY